MMMTVRHSKRVWSAAVIASSEKLSSALVGSSRSIISGFFRNIFAIARRCFCPQESRTHLSPISVSSPSFISKTKSHLARRRASWSFLSVSASLFLSFRLRLSSVFEIVGNAERRFSLMVASNTLGSCERYPICG
jgi:hypothetical protein